MKLISEKIQERRQELGYTAAYVAEMLGVKESVILRYEDGNVKKKISPKIISQLAHILQCAPSDIIDWESEQMNTSKIDSAKSYITLYDGSTYHLSRLPEDAQEQLRSHIKTLFEKYNVEE